MVRLQSPVTSATTVILTSSLTSAATVPESISIPVGSTTGTFLVTSLSTASNHSVTITATQARVSMTAPLPVTPSVALDPGSHEPRWLEGLRLCRDRVLPAKTHAVCTTGFPRPEANGLAPLSSLTYDLRMTERTSEGSGVAIETLEAADGSLRIVLGGRLDLSTVPDVWLRLETGLSRKVPSRIEIDVAALSGWDTSGASLLHHLEDGGFCPAASVSISGARPDLQRLLSSFPPLAEARSVLKPLGEKTGVVETIGQTVSGFFGDLREQVEFLGHLAKSFGTALSSRQAMRWREVLTVAEAAGVQGLPIVALINFLIGLIIAFIGSQVLATFGAQIFVADAIGIIMIRELGPIMTSILVAGRSGSAFAAELGTMKVNEELDALHTMGLDPVRFLVVQRVLAGTMVTPLLCLYGMVTGVLAGLVQMRLLGFPLSICLDRLAQAVGYGDVLLGAGKGIVFGFLVSAIGCLRGLQTLKGPSAVGASTTRAVVAGIFLIILADAVFAVITTILHV
ncbi:MAG: hypothetical protein DIJKHBIC_04618 [Thermoanaerobaculia bacterium]|nr:hypothetical protein [Thermoanaerobaculia bacterium]